MLPDAAWGFAGGVAGGTLSGIVVQWYGHRLRVRHPERSHQRDALMDVVISLERLEDAWQPATGSVPGVSDDERSRALDAVREDARAHQSALGQDAHRDLRANLAAIEDACRRRDEDAIRRAVRAALGALAGRP
jgi:hypothetical protein